MNYASPVPSMDRDLAAKIITMTQLAFVKPELSLDIVELYYQRVELNTIIADLDKQSSHKHRDALTGLQGIIDAVADSLYENLGFRLKTIDELETEEYFRERGGQMVFLLKEYCQHTKMYTGQAIEDTTKFCYLKEGTLIEVDFD